MTSASEIKTLLILDTETSGLDPESGHLLEVAVAVWSVEHRALLRARSWLVQAPSNEAVAVNGIPPAILSRGVALAEVERQVFATAVKECQAIVAHNADFDRKWFTPEIQRFPWICSMDDIEWPRPSTSRGLTALALAHGVGVASAHRALDDVLTLVRLFERAAEVGDLPTMLVRAMRPKARFQALVSYDDRELAKAAGFHWDGATKAWLRTMAIEDAQQLAFDVREVAA